MTAEKNKAALDALDHLESCLDGCYAKHEIETIRAALSAAPEVVTHNEFHRRYRASKHNDWQVYIEEDYPNGVRIVKGEKNG